MAFSHWQNVKLGNAKAPSLYSLTFAVSLWHRKAVNECKEAAHDLEL